MLPVKIRQATIDDLRELQKLFYDTVTTVNTRDYNEGQIGIWASAASNTERWVQKFNDQIFFVAEADHIITGFISFSDSGYLDFLYVHKDYQRRGIAMQLLKKVEQYAREKGIIEITSDVSITAKPFFEQNQFEVVTEQTVERNEVKLTNFKMKKSLR